MSGYLSFATGQRKAPRGGKGADSQPEVTLKCYYGDGDSLVSFYIADFGSKSSSRFSQLKAAADCNSDSCRDDDTEDREFDKVHKSANEYGKVDVNAVGDISVDGTQYLSGFFGGVKSGAYICSVPLLGSIAKGSDPQELQAHLDGMLSLLRYVCGEGTGDPPRSGSTSARAPKKLNTDKAEIEIERGLKQQNNLTSVEVECPAEVELEAQSTFDCPVTADEEKGTVNVTQTDDQGNIRWRVKQE